MKSSLYSLAVKKETASTLMVLIAIVVEAPFINQQLISGTIVNAALIIGSVFTWCQRWPDYRTDTKLGGLSNRPTSSWCWHL